MQFVAQFPGVIVVAVGDGNNHDLARGQPQWEAPGVMLDQDARKAFQAAKRRTVNHDGAVRCPVFAHISQVKAFGQVGVYLNGAQLPLAAQHVLDHKIKLGAVKGCVTGFDGVRQTHFLDRFDDLALGHFPVAVLSHVLLVPRFPHSDPETHIVHAKRFQNQDGQVKHA